MNKLLLLYIVIYCLVYAQVTPTQPDLPTHSFRITNYWLDSVVNLPHRFIDRNSETVWVDSILLQSGKHYLLDYRFGVLKLWVNRIIDSLGIMHDSLRLLVNYKYLPLRFRDEYKLREVEIKSESSRTSKTHTTKESPAFSIDDLFGAKIQKSGNIMRGFSIGSQRDFSLHSGFRMQLSGNLSEDIEVIAALTDEQSPIQPEGTTQTLQELDRVFVEVRGSKFSGVLGDYYMNLSGNEFARLQRKVQGIQGNIELSSKTIKGSAIAGGAITRGQYTSNYFQGIEGIQGPYRLYGKNNERPILVIAGTERVYLDGEQMNRGEIADYIIDYGCGEITFTSRRLISSSSRITVDFEYSDRSYNRNLFAVKANSSVLKDDVKMNVTFIREADDYENPIDRIFSEHDKDIIRSAGDDRVKAVQSGIDSVGKGRGQYCAIDTIVYNPSTGIDTMLRIYYFAPQDTQNAVYSVVFTYVGEGNGDYNKISAGNYRFVGLKKGSFLPLRFYPLPVSISMTDFDFTARVINEITLSGEYAISHFDANRFSPLDDNDNIGKAFKVELGYSPKNIIIGGINFGSLNLKVNERFLSKEFTPLDRINVVEFSRRWNIFSSVPSSEEIREISLQYMPAQSFTINSEIGQMNRSNFFKSNRYSGSMQFVKNRYPALYYNFEFIDTKNFESFLNKSAKSDWFRHNGKAEYSFYQMVTGLEIVQEQNKIKYDETNSILRKGFRFTEVIPKALLNVSQLMSIDASIGWRREDSVKTGKFINAWNSRTQNYNLHLKEIYGFSSSAGLTLRSQVFSEHYRSPTNVDMKTMLVRSQISSSHLQRGIETSWFYEVSTERSAKLERYFQRVQTGTGNYRYVGDRNGNNIMDEPDFQPVRFEGDYSIVYLPSEEMIPILDIKASGRVYINGSNIFRSGFLKNYLSMISSETYVRIDEKSSEADKKNLYLLNLRYFLNENTTLAGNNFFNQDIHIFEHNPDLSFRFRYNQRLGLTQFALQREKIYQRERSIRFRWQLISELMNQNDIIFKNDILNANPFSLRERKIKTRSIISDWSYRPIQNIEVGFKFGVGEGNNFDTTYISTNEQGLRIVYSLDIKGQVRAELNREEVTTNKSASAVPFEMTGGKIIGRSWLWRVNFDYRFTNIIQATLQYDGRVEYRSGTIHNMRMEVRALF